MIAAGSSGGGPATSGIGAAVADEMRPASASASGATSSFAQAVWKGVNTLERVPARVSTDPGGCTSVPQWWVSGR